MLWIHQVLGTIILKIQNSGSTFTGVTWIYYEVVTTHIDNPSSSVSDFQKFHKNTTQALCLFCIVVPLSFLNVLEGSIRFLNRSENVSSLLDLTNYITSRSRIPCTATRAREETCNRRFDGGLVRSCALMYGWTSQDSRPVPLISGRDCTCPPDPYIPYTEHMHTHTGPLSSLNVYGCWVGTNTILIKFCAIINIQYLLNTWELQRLDMYREFRQKTLTKVVLLR